METFLLRSRRVPVDHHAHERRVETVFDRELGEDGVGHALRDDDGADRDAGDQITVEPGRVVARKPRGEGEERLGEVPRVALGRDVLLDPSSDGGVFFDVGLGAGEGVGDGFATGDAIGEGVLLGRKSEQLASDAFRPVSEGGLFGLAVPGGVVRERVEGEGAGADGGVLLRPGRARHVVDRGIPRRRHLDFRDGYVERASEFERVSGVAYDVSTSRRWWERRIG